MAGSIYLLVGKVNGWIRPVAGWRHYSWYFRRLTSRRAITSGAAVGRRKRGHGNELRLRHGRDHHLRDALAAPDRKRRVAVIDQEHGDLTAIVRIDRAR